MSPVAAGDLPTPHMTKVHDWGDGATEATAATFVTEAVGDGQSTGPRAPSNARREAATSEDNVRIAAQPQPTKAAEPQIDAAAEVETGAEAEVEASAHEQWHTQRPLSIQLAQPDDEWREAAVSSPARSPSLGAAEPPARSPVPSMPIETTQSVGELELSEETIDLSDQGEPDQCDSMVGSTPWTEDGFQAIQQQFEEQHLAQQQQLEREQLEEQELERQLAQHQLEQHQLKQQLREMQQQRQLEQQQLEQELEQQQLVQELEQELEQQLEQQQPKRQPEQQQHKQQLDQQAKSFPIIDLFKQQQQHQQNEFVQTPESLKKKRQQPQQRQQPQHPKQSQQQNESVSISDSSEEQQSERQAQSFPIINLVKLQHMQRESESIPTTDSSGKQNADSAARQQRQQQDEFLQVNETLAQRQFKEQNELFRETYFFEQEQQQQQKESSRADDSTHRRHPHHVDKQQRRQHTEPFPVTNSATREQDDVLFSGHARVPSHADARKSSASASAADVRRRAEETRRRAGDQWSRQEQRVMQEELLLQKRLIQARNGSDTAGAALGARDSWSDLELAPTATSSRPKRTSQPFTRPANRTQSMVVRINRSTSSRVRSKPVYSNFCVII